MKKSQSYLGLIDLIKNIIRKKHFKYFDVRCYESPLHNFKLMLRRSKRNCCFFKKS